MVAADKILYVVRNLWVDCTAAELVAVQVDSALEVEVDSSHPVVGMTAVVEEDNAVDDFALVASLLVVEHIDAELYSP